MREDELKVAKSLMKKLLLSVKILPMVIAFFHLMNIIISYFGYNLLLLNYISGVSLLTILFLYIASYALKFCEYHRMFIHYCLINNIICIYDFYFTIPISDGAYLMLHLAIAAICIFLIIYFKFKNK